MEKDEEKVEQEEEEEVVVGVQFLCSQWSAGM